MKFDAHTIIHLFHIFFVGPLFLYVGINATNIPKIMFPNHYNQIVEYEKICL